MKTILELSHTEAREYFLRQENYSNIDLPKYFDFQPLLDKLAKSSKILGVQLTDAKKLDNVNYKFLTNKDGKYSWRPLQLINPINYVNLVCFITKKYEWNLIVERFKKFQQNEDIKCYSIPIISESNKSQKGESIFNWWKQIEQQSLEFALDYDCFMNTDITDCYSSIYTHTITWALHSKTTAKDSFKNGTLNDLVGHKIDTKIQSMQYSQSNGIPQGSVLMDFIAEIVLGYADFKLTNKINKYNEEEDKSKIDNYKILRYRDDYRIFATNQETLVKIAKLLTETLFELNLKLNSQKTFISDNIIKDVIKPDKAYWNEAKQNAKTLQKHLFLIHSLAEKYPNSGSLSTALTQFLEERVYPIKLFKEENSKILVSILIDIAFKNPRTYPVVTAILSKILSLEVKVETKKEILEAIEEKFKKIPNVGHLQVWLQRLTIKQDRNKEYTETLCKKVINNNTNIWNVDWLIDAELKNIFINTPIINELAIEEMKPVIEPNEVSIFGY